MPIAFNSKLRPAGYTIVTDRETGRVIVEADTRICVHCGMHFTPKATVWTPTAQARVKRGFCMRCNGPVCGLDRCLACIPRERRLDLAERGADLATIHLLADRLPVSVGGSLWIPGMPKQKGE